MDLDKSTIEQIINALLLLSSTFFICGLLTGAFFSRVAARFLYRAVLKAKRPTKIKLHDGTVLFRTFGVYMTADQRSQAIQQHIQRIRQRPMTRVQLWMPFIMLTILIVCFTLMYSSSFLNSLSK